MADLARIRSSCERVRVEASRRYIAAFERITGTAFEPNLEDPAVRIPRNLGLSTS